MMKYARSTSARVNLRSGLILGALLLSAGCDESPVRDTDNAAPTAGANAQANVTGDNNSTTASSTGAGVTGVLAEYIGKHPSERANGKRFLDEPSVRSAVAASVVDPKIREFVFNYDGPDAPIISKNGRILAWGCERHNCGYHNWSVSIVPDGSSAEVCFYHNDDSADGPSTWYLPGGTAERRAGNCPSD